MRTANDIAEIILVIILAIAAVNLNGCGDEETISHTGSESPATARLVDTPEVLPFCGPAIEGQLVYILSLKAFNYCSSGEWVYIDLKGKDGVDGIDGVNGTDGASGEDGLDGVDGLDGEAEFIADDDECYYSGYTYQDNINPGTFGFSILETKTETCGRDYTIYFKRNIDANWREQTIMEFQTVTIDGDEVICTKRQYSFSPWTNSLTGDHNYDAQCRLI